MNPSPAGPVDDTPAQTNLGQLLARALAAQQTAEAPEQEKPAEPAEEPGKDTRLCADCWNALTFKDASGRQMARCAKDLWLKPAYSYEDLNNNRVRRWHAECPEYDDTE